jgi:hypothetical protein
MNPNLELLLHAATRLKPMLGELVFVGGCATGALITDEAAAPVRATTDVDAIIEVASLAQYYDFANRLRRQGFAEDTSDGAPACRWIAGDVTLDVMPTSEAILGFTNKWYPAAIATAVELTLSKAIKIKMVNAPLFVATKLEAFYGRGKGDYLGSSDLEDIVAVIDGRPELTGEIAVSAPDIREYLQKQLSRLMATPAFREALPGHLLPEQGSPSRLSTLQRRIDLITNL